jgi:16S rRNA (guanine966-N2)-methyltransferase
MRITAGTFGGRHIKVPDGIRPTQDKVRQAIFSSLGEYVVGAKVLDLFAGSGAMGLEALSRGAADVTWVENDRRVAETLRLNIEALCPDRSDRTDRSDAMAFLKTCRETYNLVLADPPYDRGAGKGLLEMTLKGLEGGSILAPHGVLVFELGAHEKPVERAGWEVLRDREYGGTRVLIYRRTT